MTAAMREGRPPCRPHRGRAVSMKPPRRPRCRIAGWQVGMRIKSDLLHDRRAAYGEALVKKASEFLPVEFGSGWGLQTVRHCVRSAYTEAQVKFRRFTPAGISAVRDSLAKAKTSSSLDLAARDALLASHASPSYSSSPSSTAIIHPPSSYVPPTHLPPPTNQPG